jgi:tight adherence protein B
VSLLAAVATSLAVALLAPGRPRCAAGRRAGREWLPGSVLLLAPPGVAVAAVLHGRQLVLGAIALAVLGAGRRQLRRRRSSKAAEMMAGRVMEFCESVAAELVAGLPSHRVLARSVEDFPEFGTVATAAGLGSDVPAALRSLASRPGCADLRLVAAAWHVAHRSGAGLAVALERVGRTIRERRRTARLVASELAAAHATARMMAALPLVFMLAGSGLGTDPLGFLTGTSAGVGCLAVGLALSYAGLTWLHRIAEAVADG